MDDEQDNNMGVQTSSIIPDDYVWSYPLNATSITASYSGGGGGGGGSSGNYIYGNISTSGTYSIGVSPNDIVFPDGVTLTKKLEKLDQICDRLSILEPNPSLMEKYDALREAYEHYKTLEALLKEQPKNE